MTGSDRHNNTYPMLLPSRIWLWEGTKEAGFSYGMFSQQPVTHKNNRIIIGFLLQDVRFAQARFTGGVPGYVCVVSAYKKDIVRFTKRNSRVTSSVDQRFCIRVDHGCFSGRVSANMQVCCHSQEVCIVCTRQMILVESHFWYHWCSILEKVIVT